MEDNDIIDYEIDKNNDCFDNEEEEKDISKVLDDDLLEYFNDAKIYVSKNGSKSKRKKKEKIIFESGQTVFYKNEKCSVIYGPYERDGKQMYELETESDNIISAEYSSIKLK